MEYRRVFGGTKDPIEHEAVEMNFKIGSGSEPLYESDGAGGGLRAFQSRLFDQKCGKGAMSDLQYWRDQMGMAGEQVAQQNRKR